MKAAAFIVGQSLALGVLLAFVVVPGTAVFLDAFGARSLAYVYLMVAAAGAAVSYGLTSLQARLGLYRLALASTLSFAVAILVCWGLLFFADRPWVAYGILVLFALELQLGFVFIGAQAGRAFDVQQLKRIFSWIVAGFVFGFMIGGFAAAAFTAGGGDAVHLLAASSGMTLAMATLMLATARHVREPDHETEHGGLAAADDAPPRSLRHILAVPLVGAVFIYQVLSAMGTQLLEYLVYDRATEHYSGTQELAGFMGNYSAILNLVDLVVLVALGGFLMARYGLRYGLAANPLVVTALTAIAIVVALVASPDAMLFFILVGTARIADLTLADAAARTSVNATFKALPPRQRLAAQIGVEGAGVPIALGLTAVMILGINAIPGAGVTHVAIAALLVCVLWSLSAVVTYRHYQAAVIEAARRRFLDGDLVDLDEPATRLALRSLVLSDDPRDVAIGASLLSRAQDDEAALLLGEAARNPSLEVQRAVVGPLLTRDPAAAAKIAITLAGSESHDHVLDGLRALGMLPAAANASILEPFLSHPDVRIRAAAVGAMQRNSGDTHRFDAVVASAAASLTREERRFAALAIAEAGRTPSPGPLIALLSDGDESVRDEAAAAVASLGDEQRRQLLTMPMGVRERRRFLRACRYRPSPEFCTAAADALSEDGAPTAELVLLLNHAEWLVGDRHRATVNRLIAAETVRIDKAAEWLKAVSTDDAALRASTSRLRRALAHEAIAAGRRLTDLLALTYDRRLMTRVSRVLQGRSPGDSGLALEALDVALQAEHRSPVMTALRTAFDPALGESRGKARTAASIADSLKTYSADCRWAIEPDWLLACIIAIRRDLGASSAELDGTVPVGPASAELILSNRG